MRSIVDSIFSPFLSWLTDIYVKISELSIPVSKPLNLGHYFGWFNILGTGWRLFITTTIALFFIYMVVYLIVTNMHLLNKFKNLIKWW